MKMDAAIKMGWVQALRSGEYQQTRCRLVDTIGHCCLGVLADQFGMIGACEEGIFFVGGECQCLGLGAQQELSSMNDNGKSFEQIADYIEKNL